MKRTGIATNSLITIQVQENKELSYLLDMAGTWSAKVHRLRFESSRIHFSATICFPCWPFPLSYLLSNNSAETHDIPGYEYGVFLMLSGRPLSILLDPSSVGGRCVFLCGRVNTRSD